MTDVCDWLKERDLEGVCGDILEQISMPLIAGSIVEERLVVESVNGFFGDLIGTACLELPEALDVLLSGLPGPKDLEPLLRAVMAKGWKTLCWALVPGEMELDLSCWSDGEHFVAFFHDLSPHEFHRRLLGMGERLTQALGLFDAKGTIPQLLLELVKHMGVDWAGIFVWDEVGQRWMLSLEEADPGEYGLGEKQSALTFARKLSEAQGGPFGHQFGGLAIQEGSKWWVPWACEGREWEPLMTEAGFGSLFCGVLLTGSAPAVLLCLARAGGVFAKINRGVLEALWPVFLSSAERNRAVEGITRLYPRDPVSGLFARDMTLGLMKVEMDRSRRYGYPLTAMAVEITNLDRVWATGGEEAVAETVQVLSREVLKNLRSVDIGGRVGDGRIVVLLPHTPLEGAEVVSGRIRSRLGAISPSQSLSVETEVRIALRSDDCGEPEDLLARLGFTGDGQGFS